MNDHCLFCQIVRGQIPSEKVWENGKILAFKDIRPLAKKHYLFIHKEHTTHINDLTSRKTQQLEDIFKAVYDYTIEEKLENDGFRIVTNVGENGGQTVFHTHFHLLAGEKLGPFGA